MVNFPRAFFNRLQNAEGKTYGKRTMAIHKCPTERRKTTEYDQDFATNVKLPS